MANYENQPRGNSSLLSYLVNPVAQMKDQYFSTWAIGTYASMWRSGSLGFSPFYMTNLASFGKLGSWGHAWGSGFGAASLRKKIFGALFTGYSSGEGMQSLLRLELGADPKELKMAQKFLRKYIRSGDALRKGMSDKMFGAYSNVPMKYNSIFDRLIFGSSAVKAASVISAYGRLLTLGTIGITVGEGLVNLAGLAYKGAIAATNYLNAVTEHTRALEFGGTLGAGFASSAAATERQRAIQEIQRSSLSGRRFLGREAEMYSGIV